jgi:hypothetical protein
MNGWFCNGVTVEPLYIPLTCRKPVSLFVKCTLGGTDFVKYEAADWYLYVDRHCSFFLARHKI